MFDITHSPLTFKWAISSEETKCVLLTKTVLKIKNLCMSEPKWYSQTWKSVRVCMYFTAAMLHMTQHLQVRHWAITAIDWNEPKAQKIQAAHRLETCTNTIPEKNGYGSDGSTEKTMVRRPVDWHANKHTTCIQFAFGNNFFTQAPWHSVLTFVFFRCTSMESTARSRQPENTQGCNKTFRFFCFLSCLRFWTRQWQRSKFAERPSPWERM